MAEKVWFPALLPMLCSEALNDPDKDKRKRARRDIEQYRQHYHELDPEDQRVLDRFDAGKFKRRRGRPSRPDTMSFLPEHERVVRHVEECLEQQGVSRVGRRRMAIDHVIKHLQETGFLKDDEDVHDYREKLINHMNRASRQKKPGG